MNQSLTGIEVVTTLAQIVFDLIKARIEDEQRLVLVFDPETLTDEQSTTIAALLPNALYVRRTK